MQTDCGEALAVTEGREFTRTETNVLSEQPLVSDAVSVYVLEVKGMNGIPLFIPPDQLKVNEPLAVNAVDSPEHRTVSPDIVYVGKTQQLTFVQAELSLIIVELLAFMKPPTSKPNPFVPVNEFLL